MKIKPSTLYLAIAAVLLTVVALIVQQQPAPQSADSSESQPEVASEQKRPIFNFQADDVQAFTLQTRLRTLKFERDQNGKWQMLEPDKATASDPAVVFLLDLITTEQTPRSLTAPSSDREQFGLHQPIATIDLTLKDKTTHKLVVGDYDFNRSSLYAQADPPAEAGDSLNLVLVSPNFENAVNRPLAEWKQSATAEKSSEKSSESPAPPADSSGSASPKAENSSPADPPAEQPQASPSVEQ